MKEQTGKYRLGAVSFLNAIPLIDWFATPANTRVQVSRALPSRLAGLLADDEIDVALLPVVEIFRGRSGGMLPGTGIAGKGPVDSVKIISGGPPAAMKHVIADRGSRSSVALLEILLREMSGACPEFEVAEPKVTHLPGPGEGVLVIGDRCFEFDRHLSQNPRPHLQVHDLGRLWTDLTGLPFIFAAWAVSPRFLQRFGPEGLDEVKGLLNQARDHGVAHLGEIAAREAARGQLGLNGEATAAAIDYYYRNSLRYAIGEEEMQGMLRFEELCRKYCLVPEPSALKIL
jgi:chorismate dehydratase